MPNGTYGGVRGRKTKVGRKLRRFPPTRLIICYLVSVIISEINFIVRFLPDINDNKYCFYFLKASEFIMVIISTLLL